MSKSMLLTRWPVVHHGKIIIMLHDGDNTILKAIGFPHNGQTDAIGDLLSYYVQSEQANKFNCDTKICPHLSVHTQVYYRSVQAGCLG